MFYGLDFGINVWGSHLGVTTRREAIARDFDEMAALGFVVARWFVFCDGRRESSMTTAVCLRGSTSSSSTMSMPRSRSSATPTCRWFSSSSIIIGCSRDSSFTGRSGTGDLLDARLPQGRARVLLSREGHDALFDYAIAPFVRRYGHDGVRADLKECILAFEFMNEPDFVIDEWERDRSGRVDARSRLPPSPSRSPVSASLSTQHPGNRYPGRSTC